MINIDLDLANLSSALLLDTPNFCRGDESFIKYWNDNRIVQSLCTAVIVTANTLPTYLEDKDECSSHCACATAQTFRPASEVYVISWFVTF